MPLHALAKTWLSRAAGAGLALLGALGPAACERISRGAPSPRPDGGARPRGPVAPARDAGAAPLATREHDRGAADLLATFREAREVGSGQRGPYPFDRKGKQRLELRLFEDDGLIDRLATAGELTPSEAGLLQKELPDLRDAVAAMRPTELRNVTCYSPRPLPDPVRQSLTRLEQRLPLLEQLARSAKLRPEVARVVLATIERDLETVERERPLGAYPAKERPKVAAVREQVRARVDELRLRLGDRKPTGGLEDRADWQVVASTWTAAQPLLLGDRLKVFQRTYGLPARLEAAGEAARRLAAAGALTKDEAELLALETRALAKMPHPATSYLTIQEALPALRRLVTAPGLHPPAVRLIVAAVESEVMMLDDAKLAVQPADLAREATALRATAVAVLSQVKTRFAAVMPGTK
ncbi:MAG TPA: hypothetical protein VGQ83_12205 [Polyangia bacterium]|jgi:hypothetical protein